MLLVLLLLLLRIVVWTIDTEDVDDDDEKDGRTNAVTGWILFPVTADPGSNSNSSSLSSSRDSDHPLLFAVVDNIRDGNLIMVMDFSLLCTTYYVA